MLRNRRDVLKGLAVSAIAVTAGEATHRASAPRDGVAGTALAIPLGAAFAACTLEKIHPLARGAVTMTLADATGARFAVEVLRYDPAVPGVARAGSLAVYVSNGGGGTATTDEAHGLAAMALAAEIARREAAGARVPSLVTMSARGERARRRDANA